MDMLVTELAAALPVDVLPGPDDPANVSLPQQPLHACLFPGAAPYGSARRARGLALCPRAPPYATPGTTGAILARACVSIALLRSAPTPPPPPPPGFVRAPNPHEADLGGLRLVATAGQNIEDMAKYSSAGRWVGGRLGRMGGRQPSAPP